MKREIRCKECTDNLFKYTGAKYIAELGKFVDIYPGEHAKRKFGKAIRNYSCDICGCDIAKNYECFAVSFWADYGGVPYYEWEHEYIY